MQKKAILIGNSAYENLPVLNTPSNDIKALGATFEKYGFEVNKHFDVTKNDIDKIINQYRFYCKMPGICIFYFSGHGFSDAGKNFITCIDTDVSCLTYESDSIDRLFCDDSQSTSILFIDACRKNKEGIFTELKSRSIINARVSANMVDQYIPENTIVCFSTTFGYAANDEFEKTGMSPYSYFLNENLNQFSSNLYSLLNKTRIDVSRETNNKQIPIELSSLKKQLSFYDDETLPYHVNFVFPLAKGSPACAASQRLPAFLWGYKDTVIGIYPLEGKWKKLTIPLARAGFIEEGDTVESIRFSSNLCFAVGSRYGNLIFMTNNSIAAKHIIDSPIFDVVLNANNTLFGVSTNKGVFLYNQVEDSIEMISDEISYCLEMTEDAKFIYYSANSSLYRYDIINETSEEIYSSNGYLRPHLLIYAIRRIGTKIVCATTKGVLLFNSLSNETKLLSFSSKEFTGFNTTKDQLADFSSDIEDIEYRCMDISLCKKYLACGTADGRVIIWDIHHEFVVKSIVASAIREDVTSISWGYGNNIIAILQSEKLIEILPNTGTSYLYQMRDDIELELQEGIHFDEHGGLIFENPLLLKY